MKKIDFKKLDANYLRTGTSIFLLVAALILFEKVVGNITSLSTQVLAFFSFFASITSPFLIGFGFAYLMNPSMKYFERTFYRLCPNWQTSKKATTLVRATSILLNYIIVIGALVWILLYLIPQVEQSLMDILVQIPTQAQLSSMIVSLLSNISFIPSDQVAELVDTILAPLSTFSDNLPSLLTGMLENLYSAGRITVNVIMATFISFYMLYDKENFCQSGKRMLQAFLKPEVAEKSSQNLSRINDIFQSFLIGKALDSLLIGLIAFIGFTLLGAPFAPALALLIGITNMIPYFGPFIGGIPAFLLILLIEPLTGVWVGLFILALQQFDGNYLGPKILGDSLDVSPLWIILGVVLGGALMGPLGMFVGVPILTTCKVFFNDYVERKYEARYPQEKE